MLERAKLESANAVIDELLTLRDWIRWGASEFNRADLYYGHGTDNAWDEAAQLVLWVVKSPWEKLEHIVDARLTKAERLQIWEAFDQRVTLRLPTPYITGIAFFAGMEFNVSRDTLIPRSPIAELIINEFQPWLPNSPRRILDLCTGSGCIGIACAAVFAEAQVDLSDISAPALQIAQSNIRLHRMSDQVRTVASDLFANIDGQYDLIVSNPPYVDAQDMANLPEEYRVEPVLALASGFDGLDFTRRLLREAHQYLSEEGLLIVEVGNSSVALEAAFPEVPFLWIEFAQGGEGVFALTKAQLLEYQTGIKIS